MKQIPITIAVAFVFTLQSSAGLAVRVSEFGAIPDDGKDDTAAIRDAIAACDGVDDVTLKFSPGRYDLSGPNQHRTYFTFKDRDGLVVQGVGATFVLHEPGTVFAIVDSQRVRVENLAIDMDPLPFAGGRVTDRGDDRFDMEVVAPHTVQDGQVVKSILTYDLENRRVGIGTDIYQLDATEKIERLGENAMRVRVHGKPPEVGSHVIARYEVYGPGAFQVRGSKDVTVEAVTIHTIAGMGLYATNSEDLTLRKFDVALPEGSGRWMTATADATHFNNCRGVVTIENCLFEAMGDDATNIHQMYLRVRERIDPQTVRLEFARKGWWAPEQAPRVGDQLEFGPLDNPMTPVATSAVGGVNTDPATRTVVVRLKQPLPEAVVPGAIVGNASACPSARIRGCTVRNNRARGFLIKTRDVNIEDNRFEYTSAAGLHVSCDTDYWCEGMGTRNVAVRGNTFLGCNFWRGNHAAAVAVYGKAPDNAPVSDVHRNMTFENNTIREGQDTGFYIHAATDVTIQGNRIESPAKHGVILRRSRNVRIVNNTLHPDTVPTHVGEHCENVTTAP